MQNQEHIYNMPEPTPLMEPQINSDPREQAHPQETAYTPYTEGYRGNQMHDIWNEGQKLQPTPPNNQLSTNKLLVIIALLCLAFIAGSHFGVLLSWLSWSLVAVLIIVAIALLISHWRVVVIPMPTRTFQINEHARLVLKNSSGHVTIRRGEEGVISVTATKRVSGLIIQPEQTQVHYGQENDTVGITTNTTWNVFQLGVNSVDFEITVPSSCDMLIHNGWGNLLAQGTQGDIRLSTGSGGIEVRDLQGQITMKTGSGGIKANYVHGQILASTGSGGIKASFLEGQAELKTGSGGIDVVQSTLVGTSSLKTGSGGISFTGAFDPGGQNAIITGSGGIRLQLPLDAAFSLNAKTGSGGVHNEFGSNEVGNGPRTQLKLRTGSGGIYIGRSGVQ